MSKKTHVLMASIIGLGVCAIAVGCKSNNNKQEQSTVKYEGDMLYNGFDSVADIYRVEQMYTWGFNPADGKLEIVGKDNFLPVDENAEEEVEVNTDYQSVIAQIDALPELSAVTFEHKDAVAKARRAYGSLPNEYREKVTNIDKLVALENSDALKGYYTIGDLGGGFSNDLTGATKWSGHSGKLVNAMNGKIIFKASNICAEDGAFYVALFHDGSINQGQSGDGIYMMFRNNLNSVGFSNSTEENIKFNEGKSISADETYTFEIGYTVAEDYSKLTVSILVVDSQGEEIVNGSQEIATFNLTDFGEQTVKTWLCDDENAEGHKTFYINAGASQGVNVFSAWTPTSVDDYGLIENKDPHKEADLSPRQGEGALRVSYERGAITDILARFDNSLLQGLPVKEMGSFSVKVYNDSEEEKQVTLSLMKEANVNLLVDGGEFTLAPYAWTECKVTLLPVITEQFEDQLIGLSIRFKDVAESVYYLDDFRVQFGPVYTDEINAWIEKANALETEIKSLVGKTITVEDKALLEELCTKYDELPQSYRYTVKNADILTQAVTDYMSAVSAQQIAAEGKEKVVHFDSPIGAMQVVEVSGGAAAYTTEEVAPNTTGGSMGFTFDGSLNWTRVGLTPTKKTGYDEIHVWVNNKSEYKRAFYLDWQLVDQAFDAEGNEITLTSGYVLPENSGWIRLVYRNKFPLTQINATTLSRGFSAIASVDTLLVGNIEFVYNFGAVEDLISALPEYYEGYSEADVAAVAAAREAYGKLSIESQLKVANLSVLVGLEANIWKSGFSAISVATPEELTMYSEADKAAIDALRTSYEQLSLEVRKLLKEEENILCAFEEKIEQAQLAYVENVKTLISALDGTDNEAVAAAREAYDSLTDANKAKVDNANILFGFEADIWAATVAQLPTAETVVDYDVALADTLFAVRTAYEALTDEVKALVQDEVEILSAVETRLAKFGEVVLKHGQIKVTISEDAESKWHVVNIAPTKKSGYDEARVVLRNDSEHKTVFQATWKIAAKAYDEAGNEVNLVGGYIVPANSGWLTLVFTENFAWSEFDLVLFNEANAPIAGEIDFTIASVTFIYKAPAVEAMIDALNGTNQEAIAKARAAYDALSADSKAKVANFDKLLGFEADIWAEGMAELPTSAEEITSYDAVIYGKVNAMLASYSQLDVAVQAKLTEEKALLDSLKVKYNSFQSEIIAAWKTEVASLPTVEEIVKFDADLADKLAAIRAEYETFADDAKLLIENEEATLAALEEKLAQFGEVVGAPGNIVKSGEAWYTVAPNLSKTTGYQEAHVKLRNNGTGAIAFQVNWNVAPKAFDASGNEITADKNGVIAANSGWITLVFTKTDIAWTEFNINDNANVGNIDVTVESVTFIYQVPVIDAPTSEIVATPGNLTGTGEAWYTFAPGLSKTTGYLEAHVKLRNNGTGAIAFQVNWNVAVSAYDADGKAIVADKNGIIAANSGWITLVFTQTDIAWTEFNINDNASVGNIDVTVESVTFVYNKPDEVVATPGNLTGTGKTWYTFAPGLSKTTGYKEAHVKLCNNGTGAIAFQVNWNVAPKAFDASGNEITADKNGVIAANSGWITLVFTQTDIAWTEFNINDYGSAGNIDVTVESVTFVYA